jgi:hypothetical protein
MSLGGNNVAAFNAIAFSKKLIMNLDRINVMLGLVNRDWEGDLKNQGDTVQVRTLGSITMSSYDKTTDIAYENLAPVKEPFTVDDAQYFAFAVDDTEEAQTDEKLLDLYSTRAAVEMTNVVEAKLLSNYASALAANRITGASNAAITLDKDNVYGYFVEARTRLSKQNVPLVGRWAVVDPDTTGLLLKSPDFTKATSLGDSVMRDGVIVTPDGGQPRPGFIGRIAGFDVYESNAVPVASGAKYLQFGDKYAISYAAQISKIETIRLQNRFATACRGLLLHDSVVFAEASKRLATIKAVA